MKYVGFVLGCAATGAMADVPKVAVDIAPVHSIVSAVMGDLGTPDLVIPAGASPHNHALRPSEARALDQADVVVWMGHALAPWLEGPVESLAGDAVHVELLDLPQTMLLDFRTGATFGAHDHDQGHDDHDDHGDEGHADAHDHDDHEDHGEEDHADAHDHDDHEDHGEEGHADAHDHDDHDEEKHADAHDHDDHDDHGEEEHAHDHDTHAEEDHAEEDHADADDHADHGDADPHAWLDPENAIIWAGAIAEILGEKDPENAATYAANAQAFGADIEALKGELAATLEPVKGRPFVVFHDAFHYFEERFGIEAAGAVSAGDAVSPSAARVAEVRAEIAELGAVCVLTEPQFNPGIVNAIGSSSLGVIDPLGAGVGLGAGLYREVLTDMATSLAACLKSAS